MKDILTTREAADIVDVSPGTMSDFAKNGRLPAQKVGNAWAYKRADVKAFAATYDKEAVVLRAQVANGRKASLRAGGREVSPALALFREFARKQRAALR